MALRMALMFVFLALMLADSTVAAPPPELAIGRAGIKSFMKIKLVPKTTKNSEPISRLDKYLFIRKLGSGSFGESWMVRLRNGGADHFVIKKIKKQVIGYSSFRLSGLREKYFGELLSESSQEGRENVIGFVDSFTHSDELYIVSLYGGVTLYQLMYETQMGETVWKPSSWWKCRQTEPGRELMKTIIFQLLTGVKFLHQNNITHRDIKPSNMVICLQNHEGSCSTAGDDFVNMNLRIIDFGSAIDDFSRSNLYGRSGPSRAEQTWAYMPPEALLDDSWIRGSLVSTSKYDTWTFGQVILELILGTPIVFHIDRAPTTIDPLADQILDRIRGMSRFCINIPWARHYQGNTKCSDAKFSEIVKSRDPLHLGFLDVFLLQLARELLTANPEKRLTAEVALKHPYFKAS